ncbi:MAG: DUF89 domain-containing protein [Candidatus Thorarchaeota archaeon]
MLLEPECLGCLIDQICKALILLRPSIKKELIIDCQKKMMDYLTKTEVLSKPGPLIGKKAYEFIAETLGETDPYKTLKDQYNCLALEYYDKAKEIIDKAEDPLFEAIAIAAIGNTIDFGAHHDMNLIRDLENFSPEDFKINDIAKLKINLERSNKSGGQILILGDNAGEIVFDKLLIITLKRLYPNLDIIYSVRAGPIINDATIEDAKFVGLTDIVKVIEAPATPGIELSIANEEFKKYFYANGDGIILSKGQGNFESLYGIEPLFKEVYYLLKAKCPLMERIFNVKIGDLIFKKKTSSF